MSWQEEAHRRAKSMKAGNKFKLTEGQNTFRVLPNLRAVLAYKKMEKKNWTKACSAFPPFVEFLAYREVGPDKKFIKSGRDVYGQGKCWISDVLLPRLEQSRSSSDRAAAKAMQPQEQYVIQVAWLDNDNEWQGPGFFYVPAPLRPHIMSLLGNLDGRLYDHPKKSKNITINRTGTGMRDTKYGTIMLDEDPSVVPHELVFKVESFTKVAPEYSEIIQKEAWGDDLPDVDEPEDEAPPRRRKKTAKPQPVSEEEDDEDEDEGAGDNEEDDDTEDSDEDDSDTEGAADSDSDDEEEDEGEEDGLDDLDEDDEEDGEEPPPAKKKSNKGKRLAKGKAKTRGGRAISKKSKPPKGKRQDSGYIDDDDDVPF